VGLALSGNVVLDAVVAQGCRPIGDPLRVTEAEGNVILSLEGRPPLVVLQDLVERLSPADRQLARHALFIGLLMDEFKLDPTPGDFLIRVILGVDPRVGAIAIGDRVRSGQTVQFHLRDAQTSAEDLRSALRRYCLERNLGQDSALSPQPWGGADVRLFGARQGGCMASPTLTRSSFEKSWEKCRWEAFLQWGDWPRGGIHLLTRLHLLLRHFPARPLACLQVPTNRRPEAAFYWVEKLWPLAVLAGCNGRRMPVNFEL
jgi:hypothetical protein